MKYVALLRGINVGGNNIIKMEDLKRVFITCGFTKVATLIQSGNVIFESGIQDSLQITEKIEQSLSKAFSYSSTVIIRSQKELKKILYNVPTQWKIEHDLRCYILYVKAPLTAEDVGKEVELHEGIDFLSVGEGVLYMSTTMDGLTKSKFAKLIGKKVYKDVTIRNFKTSRLIEEIMNS